MTRAIAYACLMRVGWAAALTLSPAAAPGEAITGQSDAGPPAVIRLPPAPEEDHRDCVAQRPERGVLDWTSPLYRRIDVREEQHVHCDVERDETGRLRVELAYDFAL